MQVYFNLRWLIMNRSLVPEYFEGFLSRATEGHPDSHHSAGADHGHVGALQLRQQGKWTRVSELQASLPVMHALSNVEVFTVTLCKIRAHRRLSEAVQHSALLY